VEKTFLGRLSGLVGTFKGIANGVAERRKKRLRNFFKETQDYTCVFCVFICRAFSENFLFADN
jgi:hypothetical protein